MLRKHRGDSDQLRKVVEALGRIGDGRALEPLIPLLNDERFDEVGPAGEVLWFLNRLEPVNVIKIPSWLKYTPLDVQQIGRASCRERV